MTSALLQQARDYEERSLPQVQQQVRQAFHVTGGIGWINDPNGFSLYQGEYHLFYQYHPYDTHWGPMHWGHVKTRDFIRWERLPIAMAPDCDLDRQGCFSGAALELPDGRHMLMYTGVHKTADSGDAAIQEQCLAFGDGVNYEKYEGNPVIGRDELPQGGNPVDFRDPSLWQEDGKFYAVLGNKDADGNGNVLLYESEDAIHWRYLTLLDSSRGEYGQMWECPEFFPLGGHWVLLVSPLGMPEKAPEFPQGYGTIAVIGDYDRDTLTFTRRAMQAIDYGPDFYATKTVKTADGRYVMTAWMQNWATVSAARGTEPIFGALTLPRELSLRGGRLIQNPVRELEQYRSAPVRFENVLVSGSCSLRGVSGRLLDLTVTVRPHRPEGYEWFNVKVGVDAEHWTAVCVHPNRGMVRLDRSASDGGFDIPPIQDFPVRQIDGAVKLRIIMDRHSIEVFVNDGEQAATMRIYSPVSAQDVWFESWGDVRMDVEKYALDISE